MKPIEKIKKLISDLKSNEFVEIQKENIQKKIVSLESGRKASEEYFLPQFIEIYNKNITDNDFKYEDLSGVILGWIIKNATEDEFMYGGFKLNGYMEPLIYPSNFWKNYNVSERFWRLNPDSENETIYKDFLPKLNYFQTSGHGDDGTFGCFYKDPEIYPPKIYFYHKGVWFKMDMTLEEYIDTMLHCKAVALWQYFYIDTSAIVKKLGNFKPMFSEEETNFFDGPSSFLFDSYFEEGKITTAAESIILHMERIINVFPKIFPDFDLTYFKEKYNALKLAIEKL